MTSTMTANGCKTCLQTRPIGEQVALKEVIRGLLVGECTGVSSMASRNEVETSDAMCDAPVCWHGLCQRRGCAVETTGHDKTRYLHACAKASVGAALRGSGACSGICSGGRCFRHLEPPQLPACHSLSYKQLVLFRYCPTRARSGLRVLPSPHAPCAGMHFISFHLKFPSPSYCSNEKHKLESAFSQLNTEKYKLKQQPAGHAGLISPAIPAPKELDPFLPGGRA